MAHHIPWDLLYSLQPQPQSGTHEDAATNLEDLEGTFGYNSLNAAGSFAAVPSDGLGELLSPPIHPPFDFGASYTLGSAVSAALVASATPSEPRGDSFRGFEQRVQAWLASPGEDELKLECIDQEEQTILANISWAFHLDLRLEHSPYSSNQSHELRVAIFSRPSASHRHPQSENHTSFPPLLEHGPGPVLSPPIIPPCWDYIFPDAPLPEYQPPDPSVLVGPFPLAVGVAHWGSNPLGPTMVRRHHHGYHESGFPIQEHPGLPPSLGASPAVTSPAPHQTQREGSRCVGLNVAEPDTQLLAQIGAQPLWRDAASPPASGSNRLGSSLREFFRACSSRDIESAGGACWPCRLARKRCDCGTPCRRCSGFKDASVLCRRGAVFDSTRLPFLCPPTPTSQQEQQRQRHRRRSSSPSVPPVLPEDLWPAARAIKEAKSRRDADVKGIFLSGPRPVDERNRRILANVITIEDKDLRGYVYKHENQIAYAFSYPHLITKIVWELIDNRRAARLLSSDAVDDLVGLLEAASRCEVKFHGRDAKSRLVFSSMSCLWCCMKALRLDSAKLLSANAHSSCSSKRCISPGLCGLSTHVPQYVESLTGALLGKKRNENSHWLLIFYSLCIQSYVRRALMVLEESWQSICAGAENATGLLGSANYLHTAASLFTRISAQNKGKLEDEILRTVPQRSEYLGLGSLGHLLNQYSPNPAPGADGWDKWREEGIDHYLRRIFEIHDATGAHVGRSNDGYDSDRTIPSVSMAVTNNRRNRDSKDSTGSSQIPRKKAHTATSSERAVTPTPSNHSEYAMDQTPIAVATPKSHAYSALSHYSQYSMTSIGDSTAWSLAGFSNASTVSLSTSDDGSVFTHRQL